MKTPSLALILSAAVAAPALSAPPAPSPRCDVAWLTAAQKAVAQGYSPSNDKKYLATETADGGATRPVIDLTDASKLCDASVWHYLGTPAPSTNGLYFKDASGRDVKWNWADPAVGQDWASGLGEQIKILLAVSDLYQRTDALGADVMVMGDEVVSAGVMSGLVVRQGGADRAKLKADGRTSGAFLVFNAYTVTAHTGAVTTAPADLKAAFAELVADVVPAKPLAANAPKPLKPGPALIAFRKAVVALANELAVRSTRRDLMQKAGVDAKVAADFFPGAAAAASAQAALVGPGGNATIPDGMGTGNKEGPYENALKFLIGGAPAIVAGDDETAHESAALSRLDYDLRNLVALRAAAVDASISDAKTLLKGRSVAETLAGLDRAAPPVKDPKDPKVPATGATAALQAEVLARLTANPDFANLSKLYDANQSKPEWVNSPMGKATIKDLAQMRADAAATTSVAGPHGDIVQYSVRGQAETVGNIRVADLKDAGYQTAVADLIAKTIVQNTVKGRVLAALAAVVGTPVVTPKLTPAQTATAAQLPPPPPPAKAEPAQPWSKMLPLPSDGFLQWMGIDRNRKIQRYYSKVNADLASTASQQSTDRAETEAAVNDAVALAAQKADVERQRIAQEQLNPDLTADAQKAELKADLAAHDAQAQRDIAAARQQVIDDAVKAKKYVDEAQAAAQFKAAQAALNTKVDAAYSAGIAQAVDLLQADYKNPVSRRHGTVARESGYTGDWWKRDGVDGRVDGYFQGKWLGDKAPAAIQTCKTTLGFKADGNGAGFKDPSVGNVEGICGVHVDVVNWLKKYKGKSDPVETVTVTAKK